MSPSNGPQLNTIPLALMSVVEFVLILAAYRLFGVQGALAVVVVVMLLTFLLAALKPKWLVRPATTPAATANERAED